MFVIYRYSAFTRQEVRSTHVQYNSIVYLEVSRSRHAAFTTPYFIQQRAVCLSNGSTHSQRVVCVDMFLVRFIASLSSQEVLSEWRRVAEALQDSRWV